MHSQSLGRAIARAFPHRRRIVAMCIVALAAGLIWRVVDLQLNHNEFLTEEGDARHLRIEKIPAHRGMLLDRNGEPLAVSTPLASVWVNPKKLEDSRAKWPELELALALDAGFIERVMEDRGEREFVYLRRHVEPSIAEAVGALEMRGVHLKPEYRRYYPMGAAASHVLGFTGIDDTGQEGLELAFEETLSGEDGARRVIRDRLGRTVENLERLRPARPGSDIVLSIDRRIQSLTWRALGQGVRLHRARAGSAVVMDVRTGEVLAVANLPSFNPNDRGDRSSWRFRNRAVTDLLEPGSTIKPFTIAAALHEGIVRPDTILDTRPGFLKVGRHTVWDIRNYGVIDVRKVIKKSSNVGAGKLALELEPAHLREMFRKVGFGSPTGSGFPGEREGTLTDSVQWGEIHRVTPVVRVRTRRHPAADRPGLRGARQRRRAAGRELRQDRRRAGRFAGRCPPPSRPRSWKCWSWWSSREAPEAARAWPATAWAARRARPGSRRRAATARIAITRRSSAWRR